MPFIMGSVTPRTALAAMAASIAEPPFAQNFCARRRGLHVAGGDDAVAGNDHGAGVGRSWATAELRAQDECEQDADWH